jgi:hypothetical protein
MARCGRVVGADQAITTEQLDPVKVLEVFVAGRRQILQPG